MPFGHYQNGEKEGGGTVPSLLRTVLLVIQ